jgi:hypothetical protein
MTGLNVRAQILLPLSQEVGRHRFSVHGLDVLGMLNDLGSGDSLVKTGQRVVKDLNLTFAYNTRPRWKKPDRYRIFGLHLEFAPRLIPEVRNIVGLPDSVQPRYTGLEVYFPETRSAALVGFRWNSYKQKVNQSEKAAVRRSVWQSKGYGEFSYTPFGTASGVTVVDSDAGGTGASRTPSTPTILLVRLGWQGLLTLQTRPPNNDGRSGGREDRGSFWQFSLSLEGGYQHLQNAEAFASLTGNSRLLGSEGQPGQHNAVFSGRFNVLYQPRWLNLGADQNLPISIGAWVQHRTGFTTGTERFSATGYGFTSLIPLAIGRNSATRTNATNRPTED